MVEFNSKHDGRLSLEEIATFNRQGYIGPFSSFAEPQLIDYLHDHIEEFIVSEQKHPLYNRFSVRDLHLINDKVLELFCHEDVICKLQQLLGNDLLIWRSKAFYKKPGALPLGWHQEWGEFDGEEIGNCKPSLKPSHTYGPDEVWNLTVWFALQDIPLNKGPIRFSPGSVNQRFPLAMVPMVESAFWHDPFIGVSDVATVVRKAQENSLILDIRTDDFFKGVDLNSLTMDEAKEIVFNKCSKLEAKITPSFNEKEFPVDTLPMKKGSYVIFTERCMHGSSANTSDTSRLAINCRVTRSDVLVYPGRLEGDFIDSSNIDISKHSCILISGKQHNMQNVVKPYISRG